MPTTKRVIFAPDPSRATIPDTPNKPIIRDDHFQTGRHAKPEQQIAWSRNSGLKLQEPEHVASFKKGRTFHRVTPRSITTQPSETKTFELTHSWRRDIKPQQVEPFGILQKHQKFQKVQTQKYVGDKIYGINRDPLASPPSISRRGTSDKSQPSFVGDIYPVRNVKTFTSGQLSPSRNAAFTARLIDNGLFARQQATSTHRSQATPIGANVSRLINRLNTSGTSVPSGFTNGM